MKHFFLLAAACLYKLILFAQSGFVVYPGIHVVKSGGPVLVLKNMNLVNNGTFVPGNGTVQLTGTNARSVNGTNPTNFYNLYAIRFSALYYLLKPVEEKELKKAIERFKAKRIYAPAGHLLFKNFMQNISQGNREKFKLALADTSEVKFVALDEIIRLQSESNYTHIFLKGNRVFVSAKTLKEYDEILQGHHFIRVHKSHLVSPIYIESYNKSGEVILSDGTKVEVARRKKEYVLEALKGIGL